MLSDVIKASILWGIQPIFIIKSLPFLSIKLCLFSYAISNIFFYLYFKYIKKIELDISTFKNFNSIYGIILTISATLIYFFAFKYSQNKSLLFIAIAYCFPILLSSLLISNYKNININIESYLFIILIMVGICTLLFF